MEPIRISNLTFTSKDTTLLTLPEFTANSGEIHAIIGESGSGKSLLLKQIIGLLPKNIHTSGKVHIQIPQAPEGNSLDWSEAQWRLQRGKNIGMIFQEPLSALNPQMTCGRQLQEAWNIHAEPEYKNKQFEIIERLHDVGLGADAQRVLASFPHQLSGGQRQRVVIAMATLHKPPIILADEPTTALDFFSRKKVLDDLLAVVKKLQATLIWVTHELDIVAEYAHQITVLKKGEWIQTGTLKEVLERNPHPYVLELLHALPTRKKAVVQGTERILDIQGLGKIYPPNIKALDQFEAHLGPGETLAVIGTSGSGKSTLAKLLVALEKPSSGRILLNGQPLAKLPPTGIQMVFQDPFSSLNRKHTAQIAMMEVRKVCFPKENKEERLSRVQQGLKEVALDLSEWNKRPTEMSGGQRQRLCIAKALASNPRILILDEAVAALDPIVQKQVLDLLQKIQKERQLIFVFITHDLAVARALADKMIFLEKGEIKEIPPEWLAHMPKSAG